MDPSETVGRLATGVIATIVVIVVAVVVAIVACCVCCIRGCMAQRDVHTVVVQSPAPGAFMQPSGPGVGQPSLAVSATAPPYPAM
ncbi:uncharacterized protein LOC144111499 isoform X2 [Amblyomma americanum]|uniref:Uncharacterized protein n=1 Tax=Amblyomma americanum TaxID=6943 RepID=A0AAQ4DLT5_AMBAM